MPSERPEFKFDNPFKVDVDFPGFLSKKKSENNKGTKKAKGKKKPKDAAEAEAAAAAVANDEADDADEMKPIMAASQIKDADVISLKSPPKWLPMPKIIFAAFIINIIMILVATVVSSLALGGSITVKANAIGLTQSLVLFSGVFGLVYIGFHCVAARKALGIGLFRRRYRRPLHTTIVQIGRITVALWLVSMLAVGITIAKEPSSETGSLSVLKAELACCLINVFDMLVVVFVVERTRMPFVLPWISPPVPEGEALSLHAKALIEDILGDGVAGHPHAGADSTKAVADGLETVDTPVAPPAKAELEAAAASTAAAAAVAVAPPAEATPAAFSNQPPVPPPSYIYPGYTPYNPYAAYLPYTPHTPPPPAVAPASAPGPAPATAPDPAPAPAPAPAPPPAPAPLPSAMATPRMAMVGQSSVQPTHSVTFAIPPQTPMRSSYALPSIRTPTAAPAYSTTGLSSNNPSMYDTESAMRSEVWSRADEGSYTTAPAGMHTPTHRSSHNVSHNSTPFSTTTSSGNSSRGARPEQRPLLPPFAPLPLSSYVSPMQSSLPSSMYGPRPYLGRSGQSRRARGGRGGGDESGYYEPISGHSPAPAGPRVEGKKLFNKAAEGLKAKEKGRVQESNVWEEWGNYKIPGSWW